MGLLGGVADAVKGAARIATAPLRTAGKIAGTTLQTGGNVLTNVAEGDLGGAAGAVTQGVRSQVGNVAGYFGDNVQGVKEIAGGHVEFLQGGVGLIGTPIKGAARLAGNGLSTGGQVLTEVAEGDLTGAGRAASTGQNNAGNILGETFSAQVNNLV